MNESPGTPHSPPAAAVVRRKTTTPKAKPVFHEKEAARALEIVKASYQDEKETARALERDDSDQGKASKSEDDKEADNYYQPTGRNYKSKVWKHFKLLKVDTHTKIKKRALERDDSDQGKATKSAIEDDKEADNYYQPTGRNYKSKVWKHFKLLKVDKQIDEEREARCNYCGRKWKFAGTTSTLLRHLTSKHPKLAPKKQV